MKSKKPKEPEKVNIAMFNWGPCVLKMKITPEFRKLMLKEAKKNTENYEHKLAGILHRETGYSEESKAKILPFLSNCLGVYNQVYEKYTNKKFEKAPEYILSAMWINYQISNDYNPPHDHDGKLSFVAYLQVPEELKKENAEYKGQSCGPGGIQFLYGDGPRDAVTYISMFPEVDDMYIFPAWLKHYVAPFKSDCTRISVSGNVHDSAPLNNIVKFAPKYIKDKETKNDG
tara:strand:+ start:218 stop:907 length:690 start_codon:yes stop_codon:yes gene_type:complete